MTMAARAFMAAVFSAAGRRMMAPACAAFLGFALPAGAQDAAGLVESGRARFAAGDYSGAAADLWNASSADPGLFDDIEVQVLRARAVALSGRPDAALAVFDRIGGGDAAHYRAASERLAAGDAAARAILIAGASGGDPAEDTGSVGATPPSGNVQQAAVEDVQAPQIAADAPGAAARPLRSVDAPAAQAAEPTLEQVMTQLRAAAAAAMAANDPQAERAAMEALYLTGFAEETEIERLRALVPETPSAVAARDDYLAYMATVAGHWPLAAAVYESMEAAGSLAGFERAAMLTNLATVYLEMNDLEAALRAVEKATMIDQTYFNAWGLRGMLLEAAGRDEDALAVLERAYLLGARQPELVARMRALRARQAE